MKPLPFTPKGKERWNAFLGYCLLTGKTPSMKNNNAWSDDWLIGLPYSTDIMAAYYKVEEAHPKNPNPAMGHMPARTSLLQLHMQGK
jgi:hypothetical protein